MESIFNRAANENREVSVSIAALRGQALKRLEGTQERLAGRGVNYRTAKHDGFGDMGLLGTLIMGMLVGGQFSAMMQAHFPAMDAFNLAAIPPMMDACAILRDQAVEGYRGRVGNAYYPEGRRQQALAAAKAGPKFNLVSANENTRFSFDVQADIACMCEILDMLDKLEREGVQTMSLDKKATVYDTLQQASHKMFDNTGLRVHDVPMKVAV